ncbi:MAG: SPOR domain-containing protein [Gammaproteobacteria bacterium]
MAESQKKPPQELSGDFNDDLDSMLDDTETSEPVSEELLGDDDAIDQLLMDNALDATYPPNDADDELEDLFADDSTAFDLQDELEIEPELVGQGDDSNESTNTDLADEPVTEVDEFAEIDEFSDLDEFSDEPVYEPSSTQSPEEDFTVAEFDISYDDNTVDQSDRIIPEVDKTVETQQAPEAVQAKMSETASQDSNTTSVTAALTAQVRQLLNEQAALKQKLDELDTLNTSDQGDEIERLTKSQQALTKQAENHLKKASVIAYTALGIGLAAVLMASISIYSVWSSSAEVEGVIPRVASLEENQEAIIVDNHNQEFKEINAKIEQQNQALLELNTQLANLSGTDSNTSTTMTSINEQVSAAITQQQTLNESISKLTARIKRLETNVKSGKPIAKKSSGKVTGAEKWSVNLVSFRQKWYANRKAAEFAKNGIPVEVIAVQVNGEPWYRLTVKGFKTKTEASAYATRIKKSFNLDSIWLGKD